MAAAIVNRDTTIEVTILNSLSDVDYFDNLVKANTELRVEQEVFHFFEDGELLLAIEAADITDPAGTTEQKAEAIQGYLEDIPPATGSDTMHYKGDYNAATNNPDLESAPPAVDIRQGDVYTVSAAGTFFTTAVNAGDLLIAEEDDASEEAAWTIIHRKITGVYDNAWIDAAAFVPRTTNGAAAATEEYATNDINIDYYLFDSVTEEGIQAKIKLPDDWDGGTIKAKIYWDAAAGASPADLVSWGIRARAYIDDDAIDAALGTQQVTDDVVIAVGDNHTTPATAAITIGGSIAIDSLIILQIVRNVSGNDNMTEDAKFLGVDIQFRRLPDTAAQW